MVITVRDDDTTILHTLSLYSGRSTDLTQFSCFIQSNSSPFLNTTDYSDTRSSFFLFFFGSSLCANPSPSRKFTSTSLRNGHALIQSPLYILHFPFRYRRLNSFLESVKRRRVERVSQSAVTIGVALTLSNPPLLLSIFSILL